MYPGNITYQYNIITCSGNTIQEDLTTRLSLVMHKCVNLEPPLGYTISNRPHMIAQHATYVQSHYYLTVYKSRQCTADRGERIAKLRIKLQKANQPAGLNIIKSQSCSLSRWRVNPPLRVACLYTHGLRWSYYMHDIIARLHPPKLPVIP